jgi:periplasmic divalent cation tolerance protein
MIALLILSTFPDLETARRIGRTLVEEQLVACVNLVPGVESIYQWKGQVEASAEILGIFKTVTERYYEVEARIRELHPYELPEILAISPKTGLSEYFQWIEANSTSLRRAAEE